MSAQIIIYAITLAVVVVIFTIMHVKHMVDEGKYITTIMKQQEEIEKIKSQA